MISHSYVWVSGNSVRDKKNKLLIFGFIGLATVGLVALSPAIYAAIEPHITIMMDPGQTTNPLQIKDDSNNDVFSVDTTGNIFPDQIQHFRFTPTQTWINSIIPVITSDSPDTVIAETSESGAGVYQWEYTIQEGDLPTADSEGMFLLEDITVGITYNAENVGAGSIVHNTKQFINDVEFNLEVNTVHNAGNFAMLRVSCWTCFDYDGWVDFGTAEFLDVGDTIGIKIWTDSANDLVLRDVVLYAVPTIVIDVESWGISTRWSSTEGTELCVKHDIVGIPTVCANNVVFQGVDGSSQNWLFDIGYYVHGQPIYDMGGVLQLTDDATEDLMGYTFGVYPQEDWIRYSAQR